MAVRQLFVAVLLGGVGVAHGLSLFTSRKAHHAALTTLQVSGPPTEKDVMDALAYVNASLSTAEDAIKSANSTAYSMADNALQAMAEFQTMLGSLATAKVAGRPMTLTKDQADEATRLIDTVGKSVQTAQANISTKMGNFSSNLSAMLPLLNAIGQQITTQFLEALTMVEDFYNVSQSEESLYARQAAKRAARKAVRQLKALNDEGADNEETPPEQVGVLRRLVDKFGWESAKRIMHRAVSKLHGEDAVDDEDPQAINLMVDSRVAFDESNPEDVEARSLLDGHVLSDLGVDDPDDLDAALLRKGPADIERHDACAQATQKIFHANKTLHKLSRKFSWVKTTVHRTAPIPVGAGAAGIDLINNTAYSSLAEVSDVLEPPMSKGLRKFSKVRFHMGRFAQHKTLILDAVSTLAKTTPLVNTLRSAVDETCLSGACGETAKKACEEGAAQAPLAPSSSSPEDAEDAPVKELSSSVPVHAPPTEKDVMDELASVNASLSTMEDAIDSANSAAYSMADNALQAISELQNRVASLATDAGRQSSLTKEQASQATRFIDTVGSSVATAKANVTTKMDAFSNNLSAISLQLHTIGKQITTQFLEALTMVEDIYNVSQSEESVYARQSAKRAARKAVRELKAFSDDAADNEVAPEEQAGVLKRLVDKFGWESAKRILRRAVSKLHGEEDVEDEEISKAVNLMIDSGLPSDDNSISTAEELEARSILDKHVLRDLDVDSPDDLDAALLRKGPADIDRHDACAQATQKIYHANKTLHKLSRKFSFAKTTVHKTAVLPVGAGVAAIHSVNSSVYSALAELSDIHEHSVAKELRQLGRVRFHMGRFAQHKSLVLDAVSTLAKTGPIADTLRSDVDAACLSGACGEAAQKACEASAA